MLKRDELGAPVEIVRGAAPSPGAARMINVLTLRAWQAVGVTNWRKWTGKQEDPIRKLITEAYALGKRDAHVEKGES